MAKIKLTILYLSIGIACLLALFPIYYLFLTSIKTSKMLFETPPRFLFDPSFKSYESAFFTEGYYKFFLNSVIVAFIATLIVLLLGTLGAFAFYYFKFRWKSCLFLGVLVTRMFPPVTTLIPIFLMIQYLKLLDTKIALILVYTAFHTPLTIWILRSFFQGIPTEIQESALLDGCSPLDVLLRIVLPLSTPGLLASGVLTFVLTWNEFLFALVLTSFKAKTAPVAVASFLESEGMIQWGSTAALGIIAISPMVLFIIFMHKSLIKGLTAGAFR